MIIPGLLLWVEKWDDLICLRILASLASSFASIAGGTGETEIVHNCLPAC